eukprot:209272_1
METQVYLHNCALSTTNKAKCWGYNAECITPVPYQQPIKCGQLGYGDTNKCFGSNSYGQLGYGDTNSRGDEANEMGDDLFEIDLGTSFIPMQIAAGYDHTCALSTAHKVKCWGYNLHGALGYGDTSRRGDEANEMGDTLLEIDLGTNFIPMQIVAGYLHNCALSTTNKAKCWGYNAGGWSIRIWRYKYHTCALSTANKVKCFGSNHRGDAANEMSDNLL